MQDYIVIINERVYSIPFYLVQHLMDYIVSGKPQGAFLNAILENNLVNATLHADSHNIHNLPAYADFLYNKMPAESWGSREKVENWKGR